MGLHKGTGCNVTLVGYLRKIPEIDENFATSKNAYILIERSRPEINHEVIFSEKKEIYTVRVNNDDIVRIKNFGYLGMLVYISGDLFIENKKNNVRLEIIAEKVDFMYNPKDGAFNSENCHLDADDFFTFNECNKRFYIPICKNSSLYAAAVRNIH